MGLPVRPGLARLWPHEKLINISHVRRQRLLRPRPSEENRLVGWIAPHQDLQNDMSFVHDGLQATVK